MPNSYFSEASGKYNYPVSPRHKPFLKAVQSEHGGDLGRVLDIGCGEGIAGNPELAHEVVEGAKEVFGVDPSVEKAPSHVDTFTKSTLAEASLPEGYFDTAFSFMVMEHVRNPEAFFSALRHCLRPGGSYIFMTPNPKSFLGLSSKFFESLGAAEHVLKILSDDLEYHHELGYEFSSESDIRQHASGFECDFIYSEQYGALKNYFPTAFLPLWYALKLKRYWWRKRNSLTHMIGRCVRKG